MISLIAALLVTQWVPPETQPTWKVFDFIEPADCPLPPIYKVGGKFIPICDLTKAFKRTVVACTANLPVAAWEQGDRIGCDIELPAGRFVWEEEIRICRGHYIHGHGSANWNSATMLFPPKTGSGWRIAFYDECMAAGEGGGGQGATLERFSMRMRTGPEVITVPTYGIKIQAPGANIRDVWLRGFAFGIEIHGDVTQTPRTNANLWNLERVQIDGTEGPGVYIHGGDSNGGLSSLLDVHTACQRGSYWKSQTGNVCSPIQDHSFLGNLHNASHASGSIDKSTGENFGNYHSQGAGQKGTFINPYSESDVTDNILAPNTIAIGGSGGGLNILGGWRGGLRLVGPLVTSLRVINDLDPANIVETRLGSATNTPGVALQMRAPSGDSLLRQPLNVKVNRKDQTLDFEVASLTTGKSLQIGLTPAAKGSYGGLVIPRLVKTTTVAP